MYRLNIHLIFGILVVAGVLIGVISTVVLIPQHRYGGSLIDLRDLFKNMLSFSKRCSILVEDKTINVPENYTLSINTDDSMIEVYSWDKKPVGIYIYRCNNRGGYYNIAYNESSREIRVEADKYRVVVYIPATVFSRKLSIEARSGTLDIELEKQAIMKTEIIVDKGVANMVLKYSGYPETHYLDIEMGEGVLDLSVRVPGDMKISIDSIEVGGISNIVVDHKSIKGAYVDNEFINASSRLKISITMSKGIVNAVINHEENH